MVFDAPGRFSTTNGWPKTAWYLSASMRAMMSVPPPGEAPTMMRTGLVGQVWASGEPLEAAASARPRREAGEAVHSVRLLRGRRRRVPYRLPVVQRGPARQGFHKASPIAV